MTLAGAIDLADANAALTPDDAGDANGIDANDANDA
jgi:hypothetical protein